MTRPLLSLLTGTGKTVIFAHLITQRAGRALVLAHRDELIQQAADKIRLVDSSLDVGIVKAERDETDAPVVVGSVQTLYRPRRLSCLWPNFRTVIVDEAHHATADSYRRILTHVGAFTNNGPLTLGVTATPERADGNALGDVWQEIIYLKTILEMILAGYLADIRGLQVRIDADFTGLHVRHGDYVEAELDAMLSAAQAPELVARAYREHADGRTALVFTPLVSMTHAMSKAFQGAGITAKALDGRTPLGDRRAILERLASGATRVVANCAVLTEGFDEPRVDCVIVARPTRSKPLYVQMIGRGTRLYPGKSDCLLMDLVGASSRHDLITASTLFGVSPKALAEQPLTQAIEAREGERQDAAAPRAGRLVATPVDLFRRRPLHWLQVGTDGYVLSLGEGGWLTLQPQGDRWDVVQVSADGAHARLASGLTLAYGQGIAEDHARAVGASGLVNPKARWRTEPATDGQRRHLRYLRLPVRDGLTKGEAADLISIAKASRALLRKQVAHAN